MKSWVRRLLAGFALAVVVLVAAGWWLLRSTPVPELDLPGVLEQGRLTWEDRPRTYEFYRPSTVAGVPAVVFVLHGSMGDGAGARAMMAYEFDRLAEENGFLAVYPDGFDSHWNGCRAKGPYKANELDVDDVGFLRAIVDRLVESDGVDRSRVFATGVSNGGHMAIRLALEAPDFVRAVAPIAASLPSGDNLDCTPSGAPVAVLLINGTEDPMNPFEGGTVALFGVWGNRGTVHSTMETTRFFAKSAGYGGDPAVEKLPDVRTDDSSTVVRHRWSGGEKPEVVLLAVHGGGHTVPHPEMRYPRIIGPTNADLNAAEEIWAFFDRAAVGAPVEPQTLLFAR
ncbi:MAG: PHB depolymerase family esterase [Candidatus Binatia bacterium]|nr:PHB depolymerase family esterase [Candidatus Binatia bacterium]